jgi:hypothetical protein
MSSKHEDRNSLIMNFRAYMQFPCSYINGEECKKLGSELLLLAVEAKPAPLPNSQYMIL